MIIGHSWCQELLCGEIELLKGEIGWTVYTFISRKWKLSVKERMCCYRFLLGVERMEALKDLWIGLRWFKVDESIKKMLTSGVDPSWSMNRNHGLDQGQG